MNEWDEFSCDTDVTDAADIADADDMADAAEDMADMEGHEQDSLFADVSPAELAADYARSIGGFDKAADYIERHFEGDSYVPGDVIPVSTRNEDLEGLETDDGVNFERKTAELAEGLSIEGVFPEFDSYHHVELGDDARDMSLYGQFAACRNDLQDHLFDSPEHPSARISFGEFEKLEDPSAVAPEGYTWHHNIETGSFDLVKTDQHRSNGHTGGNAFW